jgi:hypothetical protein
MIDLFDPFLALTMMITSQVDHGCQSLDALSMKRVDLQSSNKPQHFPQDKGKIDENGFNPFAVRRDTYPESGPFYIE